MFDKFYLTFNFKSKVLRDVFKNKKECQLTHTLHSKMPPQIWVTQYFRKTNILNSKKTIIIYDKKTYQLSVSILWSHMFLQMLKMVAQSIASTSSPQRETRIRASRVLKFNLLRKWFLIAFCFKNPLSQIAIIDGMSIIFCQRCIRLGQCVCHSKLLPHMRQASNIVFSHIHVKVFP
jgi:hypothetical protein